MFPPLGIVEHHIARGFCFSLTASSIVFIHGFTGHPRNTWAEKGRRGKNPEPKRGRPDDELPSEPGSKFRRIFKRGRRETASAASISSNAPTSSLPLRIKKSDVEVASDERVESRGIYWPEDLAPITAPCSRILAYGYDTRVRHWAAGQVSQKSLYDHARDLLLSLEALRREPEESQRPVLFIVHSLGGLVTKVALRMARDADSTQPNIHRIFEATTGVIFFGTPHRGADPMTVLRHLLSASATALGFQVNKRIVSALMPDGDYLADLVEAFSVMCHQRNWCVYSFQEEYGVGGPIGKKVVEDSSSCLDDPRIERKQHISKNHMDMCRFSGMEDPGYRKVEAAITFFLERIAGNTVARDPDGILVRDGTRPPVPGHLTDEDDMMEDPSPQDALHSGARELSGSHGIDAALKASLREMLQFDKIDERLTSLAAAHRTTCRWFLSHPAHNSLVNPEERPSHGGFLWIKGNPGTGKSTLMKFLFEDSREKAKGNASHITLSFFFLARGAAEERSTTGLYRALLYQLFERAPCLVDALDWMTVNGAKGVERNGWQEEPLKQTLRDAVKRLGDRSLTVFVDALDECDQGQAAGMVDFFEELGDVAIDNDIALQICFSSRHYPTIVIKKGIEVSLEDEIGHADDIKSYIRSKFRIGKSKAAQTLMTEVFDKSNHIFLWVVLVLDILNAEYPNTSVSISKMRKRLVEIPPQLADLFDMVLKRYTDNREQTELCLQWVLFSTRALTPQELYFAVQFGLDSKCSGEWNQEDVDLDQMKTFARTSSKGLAHVTNTKKKGSEVQFIHESVREYLLGRYDETFSDMTSRSHEVLKSCCASQLSVLVEEHLGLHTNERHRNPTFKHGFELCASELDLSFPFYQYALQNALFHAERSQRNGTNQKDFLATFPLRRWLLLKNTLEKHYVRQYTSEATLLYILAERNLNHLIRTIQLRESCFAVGTERYGPALFAALATKSTEAVETLLELEISRLSPPSTREVNEFSGRYKVTMTLGRNFIFSRTRTVFSYVAAAGDEGLVKLLLSHGADFGDVGSQRRTPLDFAVENGHEGVVRVPLSAARELDMAVKGGSDGHVECQEDDFTRAPLAIAHRRDKDQRTPLMSAARGGHVGVGQELLDTGMVDINARDRDGRTALIHACAEGHDAFVYMLLGRAECRLFPDDQGLTPLIWAAREGRKEVARLLLELHGDTANTVDKSGRTALSWAAHFDGKDAADIAKLLLGTGQVDPDMCDKRGRTPLTWAASHNATAVAKLLLAADRVDVDRPDYLGYTPLICAAKSSATEVVSLLLGTGQVEPDKCDKRGRTPLSWAASRRSAAIVELLLKTDIVDVDRPSGFGFTPRIRAAMSSASEVVSLLLETGKVNVNQEDEEGRTPLISATMAKNLESVQLLLAAEGIDVGRRNRKGRSAADVAASMDDCDPRLLEVLSGT